MSNPVCYFSACLDPNDVLPHIGPKVIEQLKNGEYKSANLDLKKLPGFRIYSLRLNDSDRLLFTTISVKGQVCLLLLEIIWNHKYNNSRFLKSGVLAHFMEVNGEAFKQMIFSELSFEASEGPPLEAQPAAASEDDQIQPLEYYQNTFIVLNSHQQEAKQLSLPLVMSGAAGSGKSCVAISRLREFIDQHPESLSNGILYLTQSKPLATAMRSLWKQLPVQQHQVEFLTYEQLLIKQSDEASELNFVQASHFYTWLRKYISVHKKIAKAGNAIKVNESVFENPERIYQEMRILSAYAQKPDYMALGKHHSLYQDHLERQWLWDVYQRYTHYLEANDLIHPAFQTMKSKARYAFIVVDEAQDLSHLQLKNLFDLAMQHAICFCIDTHQSLADNKSKRPFLLNLGDKACKVNYHELPGSHRCPLAVRGVANEVLRAKRKLTRGLGDKKEQKELKNAVEDDDNNQGEVRWIKQRSRSELSRLVKAAASSQFAIITLPEYIQEAKDLFKTPMVFSISEVKGLEFLDVLVYRPLDAKIYQQASQGLKALNGSRESMHRPKADQGQDQFSVPMNNLFTAFTRTKNRLFIVQEDRREIAALAAQLQQAVPHHSASSFLDVKTTSAHGAEKDWLDSAEKLWAHGNKEQALGIMTEKFSYSMAGAEAYLTEKSSSDSDSVELLQPQNLSSSDEAQMPEDAVTSKATAPPEHKRPLPKPSQGLAKKSQAYIQGLLKNFTKRNLITCLKNPKAKVYLYHIVYEERNLLSHILNSEMYTSLLLDVLKGSFSKNKKVLSLFSLDCLLMKDEAIQATYMASFFKSIPNLSSFCSFLQKHPDLLRQMSSQTRADMLEVFIQHQAPILATLNQIIDLNLTGLLDILGFFPEIAKAFTPELLLTPVKVPFKNIMQGKFSASTVFKIDPSETFIHTAFFSWLASDEAGRDILIILFEHYPDLAKQLPMEAWTAPYYNRHGINTFPLLCLSSSVEGLAVLQRLYHLNPEMILNIPVSSWLMETSKNSYKSISVFSYLARVNGGCNFMQDLFAAKPELILEMPLEAWRGDDDSLPQAITNSLFFNLSTCQMGMILLIKFSQQAPRLIEEVPLAVWKQCVKNNNNMPMFFTLHPDGHDVLLNALKSRPELIDLFIPHLIDYNNDDNFTALFGLSRSIQGREVLQMIMDRSLQYKAFDYKKMISPERLTMIAKGPIAKIENGFPLFYLCTEQSGFLILQKLFSGEGKTSFIRQIPAEGWLQRIPAFENLFPFYLLLLSGGLGFTLLQAVILENPKVVMRLTREHVLQPFSKPFKEYSSVLTLLMAYADGQNTLKDMMAINLPLFLSISIEDWTTKLLHSPINDKSCFYWLCLNDTGREIVFELLSKMPLLRRELQLAFQSSRTEASEASLGIDSAYDSLSESKLGRSILALIKVARPNRRHYCLFADKKDADDNTPDSAPSAQSNQK